MNALFLLACALLDLPIQSHRQPAGHDLAALRAEGPAALERLLRSFDTLDPGAEKDSLELVIDAVAAQRYATFSRLYWYTDLEAAEAAARASGKPILSLRMLGRLDEDLSCANSRLFRVVLYANADLSRFLRENFVLHWSSERPAPRLTIDFGDGRRIVTTVAGNSAHYVLDQDGRPLDVLPGLYSPIAFRRELEADLPLAQDSPRLGDDERAARMKEHHLGRERWSQELWAASGDPVPVQLPLWSDILQSERVSRGKAAMEMTAVLGAGLGGARRDPVYGGASASTLLFVRRLDEARLDAASRALLLRLAPTDWGREPRPLEGEALAREITGLEALVAADTEANELSRHVRIHRWLASAGGLPDFATLNERVYRELFLAPEDDPWLGLSSPGIFTALPGDGATR
jgi:hypothetical protein